MLPARIAIALAIAASAYFLLFFHMSARGLVGPDEPRYAAVAREMAVSGDWITPRLEGEPWFEKPVLLYWLGGVVTRIAAPLGLADDLATRLPVALISLLFLAFFYWILRQEFGVAAAGYATLILGTSAGWVAYSQVGGFDLPLSAALGVALLALLPWVREANQQTRRRLPLFGAFIGISLLAKGLVGPALAALALLGVCFRRGLLSTARDLLHPKALAPFLGIALPWYLLCYLQNGAPFLEEFFWRHHWTRFATDAYKHLQPFWYYGPVLLVALLPWTPILAALPLRRMRQDPRLSFLALWAFSTFLFFSLATSKLPGYLLPALPPLAALLGVGCTTLRGFWAVLAALMLGLFPLVEAVLPVALADGLEKAWPPDHISPVGSGLALVAAAAVGWLVAAGRRGAAVVLLAACTALGFIHLKVNTFPLIDRRAGTRPLWRQIEPRLDETCLGDVRRHVVYGLSYYSRGRLPLCAIEPRPLRVESDPAVLTDRSPDEASKRRAAAN